MVDPVPVLNPVQEDIDMNGRRARNTAPSNLGSDFVTRDEMEGSVTALVTAMFLKIAGDNQMLGNLNMGGKKLINLADAVANSEGANLGQVVARVAAALAEGKAYTDGKVVPPWPDHVQAYTTPGIHSKTVPAGCRFVAFAIASGAGAGGGRSTTKGGKGGPGRVAIGILAVTPGEEISLKVGGGGKKPSNALGGYARAPGGGGGAASTISTAAGSVTVGGGGGGGGGFHPWVGLGGRGGAGGTNAPSDSVDGTPGTAGTNGDGNANAGAAGLGGGESEHGVDGGDGGQGTVSSSPVAVLDRNVDWMFPELPWAADRTITPPAGGDGANLEVVTYSQTYVPGGETGIWETTSTVVPGTDAADGADGFILLRWFQSPT